MKEEDLKKLDKESAKALLEIIITQIMSASPESRSSLISNARAIINLHGFHEFSTTLNKLIDETEIALKSIGYALSDVDKQVEREEQAKIREDEELIKKLNQAVALFFKEHQEFENLINIIKNNPTSPEAIEAYKKIEKEFSHEYIVKHIEHLDKTLALANTGIKSLQNKEVLTEEDKKELEYLKKIKDRILSMEEKYLSDTYNVKLTNKELGENAKIEDKTQHFNNQSKQVKLVEDFIESRRNPDAKHKPSAHEFIAQMEKAHDQIVSQQKQPKQENQKENKQETGSNKRSFADDVLQRRNSGKDIGGRGSP